MEGSKVVRGLRIDHVVLHGIKRAAKGSGTEPELSQAESALSEQVRTFLQGQLSDALKHRREVVEEPGMSTLPGIIRDVWSKKTTLLAASQVLARNLQSAQPGIGSEGLLMVAQGRANDVPVFLVAKLEHEKGTSAQMEQNPDGALVYSMTFLDNLFFTEGSKVYKIGFFPKASDVDQPLEGFIVDRQVSGSEVATYFRETYLGCAWKQRPEVVTQRFMDTVQEWIDRQDDPEKRSRYQLGLLAELQSQRDVLSVNSFAASYLDPVDRDSFTAHAQRTLPAANMTKDLSLIESRIANIRWDTRSGTVVIASPEAVQNGTVTVEEAGDKTVIKVADDILKTSGSGRFKH
ncbi:nucleoid-associated protein [Nocardioides carbamazepini]|uniref:nucleoid-associated protein n=1 Tax=Nocardioides carbamazepini TaxID=2854259 RepID=UPI00214A272F|nr:nucleoid-associated protein [Nocardioides carbamazepini]MCR1784748.1 nucleoid-associated protein [Nocardioides carbamazepini]